MKHRHGPAKSLFFMNWLTFALMTVVSWGLYGIFLHSGQVAMKDQANGLFKAFLFVGLAYFLTAVLAPLAMLATRKPDWTFPTAGMGWSLLAGMVGAAGAFCVLLAFGAKGTPGVVMSIVFAGAPIVNAVVAMYLNPPEGGLGTVRWPFYLGILMAATGGCLVTLYKPPPARPHAPAPQAAAATVQSAQPQ
jgi:drug/metabolite transporter (DMT)-like permease